MAPVRSKSKSKTTFKLAVPETNCVIPKGILLLIGGKEDKGENEEENDKNGKYVELEILKKFVELTGKKNPAIGLVTSASSKSDEQFKDYKKAFGKINVNDIRQIYHAGRADVENEEMLKLSQTADAFFFTGGDQLLLSSIYGGTGFLTMLKQRYINEKIVVAGTSAGAMALSTPMIYAGNKDVEQIAGEIKITTGLEFLKDVCVDTHFVHRGRFVRMAQVIVTNPTSIGIGIEEDTAMIVRKGVEAEVIGNGTVIVIEGFQISESNIVEFGDMNIISMRNLRVNILGRDEKYTIPQLNPPHK